MTCEPLKPIVEVRNIQNSKIKHQAFMKQKIQGSSWLNIYLHGTVTYSANIRPGYLQYIEFIIHYTEDWKGETTVSQFALNQRKLSVWFFATKMEWAKTVTAFTVYRNSSISAPHEEAQTLYTSKSLDCRILSHIVREKLVWLQLRISYFLRVPC